VAHFLTWLLLEKGSARRALLVGFAIAFVQGGLLVSAAALDDALFLPRPGLGLLQHPGIPGIVTADAVILVLLGLAARRFVRLAHRLPILQPGASRRYLRWVVRRGRSIILLKGRAGGLFWLCVGIGSLFWLQNAIQTRDAVRFYGHDVFDSSYHKFSYIAFRLVLWGSWGLLYPYVAIAFLGISGGLYRATRTLARHNRLTYVLFHPDGCGGYSIIGDISFTAIMAVLALYASLGIVIITHHKLNILQISGFILLSAALLGLTFFIAWPVTRFLMKRRRSERTANYRLLMSHRDPDAAIRLLWAAIVPSYSPYVTYQKVLISGARTLPIIFAGIRLYLAL
jgi:hypothetical protein